MARPPVSSPSHSVAFELGRSSRQFGAAPRENSCRSQTPAPAVETRQRCDRLSRAGHCATRGRRSVGRVGREMCSVGVGKQFRLPVALCCAASDAHEFGRVPRHGDHRPWRAHATHSSERRNVSVMNSLRGETTHRASAPALPSVQRHPLSPRTASEPRSRMHPALKLHATPSSPLICGSTRQAGGHASRGGEGAAREMAGNQFPRDFKFQAGTHSHRIADARAGAIPAGRGRMRERRGRGGARASWRLSGDTHRWRLRCASARLLAPRWRNTAAMRPAEAGEGTGAEGGMRSARSGKSGSPHSLAAALPPAYKSFAPLCVLNQLDGSAQPAPKRHALTSGSPSLSRSWTAGTRSQTLRRGGMRARAPSTSRKR
jgi:hypothetical protein